jgi:hypothetical protein
VVVSSASINTEPTPIPKSSSEESSHSHSHSGSHSCETCRRKFIYKCNNNEWVNYNLDEAPAEDGIYIGDKSPGIPTFIGGHFPSKQPLRIDITDPKGGKVPFQPNEIVLRDPSTVFYLKRSCDHKYEWVNSTGREFVQNAVYAFYENSLGFTAYFGRKIIGELAAFVVAVPMSGYGTYTDLDGINQRTDEYQVLTCKSRVFETPPETTTTEAPTVDPNYTGCGKITKRWIE